MAYSPFPGTPKGRHPRNTTSTILTCRRAAISISFVTIDIEMRSKLTGQFAQVQVLPHWQFPVEEQSQPPIVKFELVMCKVSKIR